MKEVFLLLKPCFNGSRHVHLTLTTCANFPESIQWISSQCPEGTLYESVVGSMRWTFCGHSSINHYRSPMETDHGAYFHYVSSYTVSGTNLFAGTDGGVCLSTNNGTSWSVAGTELTHISVYP
jgi:hypothetical protein